MVLRNDSRSRASVQVGNGVDMVAVRRHPSRSLTPAVEEYKNLSKKEAGLEPQYESVMVAVRRCPSQSLTPLQSNRKQSFIK